MHDTKIVTKSTILCVNLAYTWVSFCSLEPTFSCVRPSEHVRKFLSFVEFKLNIFHSPYDYNPVLYKLNLKSLDDRRLAHNMIFIYYLFCGKVDSFSLFQHIIQLLLAVPERYIILILHCYAWIGQVHF